MAPSFRKVDYSLRAAKHAERKMLLEIFRRLSVFAPLSDYRYVGMGSVWFSDFQLFHRALGIPDMVSIEREGNAEARIRDNIPFGVIRPIFKPTSVGLAELGWEKRQFVWLDYDDPISTDILADVRFLAAQVRSGSVIAVSVQHKEAKEIEEAGHDGSPLDLFRSRFGQGVLPSDIGEDDLYGRPFGQLCRIMIHTAIETSLIARNLQGAPTDFFAYRRICDIEYADGAPMTTTVGILVNNLDMSDFDAGFFNRFDFCEGRQDSLVRIEVPVITPREARFLEGQLPRGDGFSHGNIPAKDAKIFADFYRYLPNFMPIET